MSDLRSRIAELLGLRIVQHVPPDGSRRMVSCLVRDFDTEADAQAWHKALVEVVAADVDRARFSVDTEATPTILARERLAPLGITADALKDPEPDPWEFVEAMANKPPLCTHVSLCAKEARELLARKNP